MVGRVPCCLASFRPPPGEYYSAVESPKGELGWYIVSHGDPNPFTSYWYSAVTRVSIHLLTILTLTAVLPLRALARRACRYRKEFSAGCGYDLRAMGERVKLGGQAVTVLQGRLLAS